MFFNTTSNSWITSYTHPKVDAVHETSNGTNANNDAVAKRVGLGAGLTLGMLAIIAVVVFFFWYNRRLKRRRAAREHELRNLPLAHTGINYLVLIRVVAISNRMK